MTPRVSVVMAAKNYGRFLAEAVESVLAQTFTDWELLIIDDGSSDDTTLVAARFADSRIRCVKSDRLGQSRAKNLGIDLARGEFIAFLDADDAWLPTKLEKQRTLFNDDVGVVFSRRTLMDEASRPLPMNGPADIPLCRGIVPGPTRKRRRLFNPPLDPRPGWGSTKESQRTEKG